VPADPGLHRDHAGWVGDDFHPRARIAVETVLCRDGVHAAAGSASFAKLFRDWNSDSGPEKKPRRLRIHATGNLCTRELDGATSTIHLSMHNIFYIIGVIVVVVFVLKVVGLW
jgi:hypothetical protein